MPFYYVKDVIYIKTKEQLAFEMIEQGVKDVYTSDNFKNYLSFLSKFHDYSFNNTILILSQYPSASLIAGLHSWNRNFKRQVNKGSKAIKILAPYNTTIKTKEESLDENGNKIQIEVESKITKFRVVNVFDVSQTSGEPLPELINDLKGTSKDIEMLIESIKEICEIPIEFTSPSIDETLEDGAKGYFSLTDNKIVINEELENLQIVKTLAHEYVHSILHNDKNMKKTQNQREIEAESLAFVLCNHFGIDTSDYSFTYIATYAQNDQDFLKQTLIEIKTISSELIDKIEPVFEKKRDEISKDFELDKKESFIERKNYQLFESIASPILNNKAYYMKYSAPNFDDLNIEIIGENRIAISHYYELNGDMMADPDIECIFDNENKILIPVTYQQDNMQVFYDINEHPELSDSLNSFVNEWLTNIKINRYKINEIISDDFKINIKNDYDKVLAFCKENNIENMINKTKRKEQLER